MSVKHPGKKPVYDDGPRGVQAKLRAVRQHEIIKHGLDLVETLESRRFADEELDIVLRLPVFLRRPID